MLRVGSNPPGSAWCQKVRLPCFRHSSWHSIASSCVRVRCPEGHEKSLNAEAGGRIDRERAQRQLLDDNWPGLGLVVWGDL